MLWVLPNSLLDKMDFLVYRAVELVDELVNLLDGCVDLEERFLVIGLGQLHISDRVPLSRDHSAVTTCPLIPSRRVPCLLR